MKLIDKIIESDKAPKSTNVIWIDTSNEEEPVEKHYINGNWRILGDDKPDLPYIGSYTQDTLPELNGFKDKGIMAFDKDIRQYVYWDGYGWTKMNGVPAIPRYLTFTANEDGSSVGFWYYSETVSVIDAGKQAEYSTDGVTWQPYAIGNADNDESPTMIGLDKGESVMFRGVNPDGLIFYVEDDGDYEWLAFVINGSIAASGDVTSLINGVGGNVDIHNLDFRAMFYDCVGLTSAPALPTTTLAEGCYKNMFTGCTGLTKAPTLPATTLAIDCYIDMFAGCTGLTKAPTLPATTLADGCYYEMFLGCTGLIQAPALPATILASGCYAYMFQNCTGLASAPVLSATTLADSCYSYMFYGCTGLTSAPVLPVTTLENHCYQGMFLSCTGLTKAPALPATTLTNSCYSLMFQDCTGLISAPILPATTLASSCYAAMFQGCTSLIQAPELPATTLVQRCYNSMFNTCSKLEKAPNLPATTLADNCYDSMFSSCVRLTQAPALPATTLANNCYSYMFGGCVSLKSAPVLPATTLGYSCYSYMFQGCTAITSHDVATLNNSSLHVFQNNLFCASLTIHAATPPTIANSTITGLKANCIIYVPAASVDAYKAKQYWSARASYIQAKPA